MDIINEIIHDHRRLRELLEKVKDDDTQLRSKKAAFRELVPLLKAHAHAEERTLYEFARKKKVLKLATLESFEEHSAALTMSEKTKKTSSHDLWTARAVVFCEMLEHHLDEEEDYFFPELRKALSSETLSDELATRYRALMPPAEIKRGGRSAFIRPITAPLEAFIP